MSNRRHFLWVAASAAWSGAAPAATVEEAGKDRTILFPYYTSVPTYNRYRRILETAYAAMGYRMVTEEMPIERGLVESGVGSVAGEISRAPIIEKMVPDLIRVPVLLDMLGVSTFVKATTGPAPSLEQAARLRVGVVSGVKFIEAWTTDWPRVERVGNTTGLVRMLVAGNIDVAIGFADNVRNAMTEIGLASNLLNAKEVERMTQYHYLHKRYAALVPGITAELNKIKSNYKTVSEGFKARGDK